MSKDIPNYSIVLDTRERKLQAACKELVIPYKTSSLALGDIHVISEKDGSIQMMIERKAWPDLASSILDNRYREQHARYTQWSREQSCEVWYVLEGPRKFRTPAQEKRTMSAYLSLCFDKQVRVIETKSPLATMEWLHKVL
jgi:ERCC4-type nuclease